MIRLASRQTPGPVLGPEWPLQRARKREVEVVVEFASTAGPLQTLEGEVQVRPGDAVITGPFGERWRVSAEHFPARYVAADRPGRYISRPNEVRATRLGEPCEVLLGDGRSILHGQPGDWLLDYGDGSLGIVAPHVFDLTYELL